MYKSIFHKGVCCECDKATDVITIGSDYSDSFNKDYCNKCSTKYEFKLNHYIEYVARFFKTIISVSDLKLFNKYDDLLKCLASYSITEEYFVIQVNKYVGEGHHFSLNVMYSSAVYLRLSHIDNLNYFINTPSQYLRYQKVRNQIRDYSGVSCSKRISIVEYSLLIGSLNALYPDTKGDLEVVN